MLTLGVETSCDETALALVKDGRLLDQKLASQGDIHSVFGGVVPELASREHLRLIDPLFQELYKDNDLQSSQLDLVAVARGPGLLGSLLVGLGFAKGLALALDLPLIGVNHLNAHLLAVGLQEELVFPVLGLLVSGGHTHIYELNSATRMQLLGRTLDDAAGEAFDKTARLLNLPYPGGVLIDVLAQAGTADTSLFPMPYLDNQNLDFSFSGLKTAVARYIDKHPELRLPSMPTFKQALQFVGTHEQLCTFCASFNWTIAETLRKKIERALMSTGGHCQGLIVAGGVAANSMIRTAMRNVARKWGVQLFMPGLELCTDNAAMIAYAGEVLFCRGWHHGMDLDAIARGQKVPWDYLQKNLA